MHVASIGFLVKIAGKGPLWKQQNSVNPTR